MIPIIDKFKAPLALTALGAIIAGVSVPFFLSDTEPLGAAIQQPRTAVTIAPPPKLAATAVIKAPVTTFKAKAKEATKLPQAAKANPREHLVAVTKVRSNLRPVEVTTTVNEDTGSVTTQSAELDLPWLAPSGTTELFAEYGLKTGAGLVARIGVNQELLRIKALTLGATAHVDSTGAAFVGARLSYRF